MKNYKKRTLPLKVFSKMSDKSSSHGVKCRSLLYYGYILRFLFWNSRGTKLLEEKESFLFPPLSLNENDDGFYVSNGKTILYVKLA